MAPNSKKHQTLLVSKEQVKDLKRLSQEVRYPMTFIVNYAINRLFGDKEALDNLRKGKVA